LRALRDAGVTGEQDNPTMSEVLEFLDGQEPEAETVSTPEAPPPAAAAEGEGAGPPTQPGPAPDGYVPLAAMHRERERARAAEEELARIRQAEIEAARAEAPTPPDREEDPQAFEAWRHAQVAGALYEQRLQTSERFALMQNGPEAVGEAVRWGHALCDRDPHFNQKVAAHPDPIGFVVQAYRHNQLVSEMTAPDTVQAFREWQAARAQGQEGATAAAGSAAPPHHPQAPPRSLASPASAPAAGWSRPGETPVGPGVAFDSVFGI
jgi:hypothetical protein